MQRLSYLSPALLLALGLAACGDDDEQPAQTGALVITSDFQSGAISSIDLDSHTVSRNVGTVHSDAACRADGDFVYVLNRLGQDNVQVLNPASNYSTVRQFTVGNGSNPQDICLVSESKAYVPVYGSAEIQIVNPQTGARLGSVNLGSLADSDGNPEMSSCVAVDDRVYVTLQNLQSFAPTGQSRVAIINSSNDTLVRGELLRGQNPFTKIVHDEARDRLLIGTVGNFGVQDGGIEAFDLDSERATGFVVTEQVLGGDVGSLAVVSASKGFAVITDGNFVTSLVSFDPSSNRKLATVYAASGFDLGGIALNDRDELYVADANFTTPGVRIYNGRTDQNLQATPLNVGLPPRDICFSAD